VPFWKKNQKKFPEGPRENVSPGPLWLSTSGNETLDPNSITLLWTCWKLYNILSCLDVNCVFYSFFIYCFLLIYHSIFLWLNIMAPICYWWGTQDIRYDLRYDWCRRQDAHAFGLLRTCCAFEVSTFSLTNLWESWKRPAVVECCLPESRSCRQAVEICSWTPCTRASGTASSADETPCP